MSTAAVATFASESWWCNQRKLLQMSALVKKCSGFGSRSPSSDDSGSDDVRHDRAASPSAAQQQQDEDAIRRKASISPEDVMSLTHITSGQYCAVCDISRTLIQNRSRIRQGPQNWQRKGKDRVRNTRLYLCEIRCADFFLSCRRLLV